MRVGVIGCGKISGKHIAPIRRQTGVEIVGVADTDEERAREIAHRFGIRYVFRDAAAMLRERRPDVVHILTPPTIAQGTINSSDGSRLSRCG